MLSCTNQMGEQDQAVVEDVEVHAQEEAGIQVDAAGEEMDVFWVSLIWFQGSR